jgi:pyruvate/2-oxoglutarate dehydrogenase complex dihydrolipoamide acyltransferase (E2) component
LFAIGFLAVAFLFGLAGVVYMSLQGTEIQVPEITGKDLSESEKELALLGLKIKKRADRVSAEKPGTVIEQLPKPGDTVKSGQLILVVTSKGGGESDVPASLKNATEEDDSEKIEEMISDKPKKPRANSNSSRKKADTARDVGGNTSDDNSMSKSKTADSNSNKKDSDTGDVSTEKLNKNTQPPARPTTPPVTKPAVEPRPKPPVRP